MLIIQPPCSFRLCLSCLSTLLSAPVINIVHIHSWSGIFRSLVDSCVLRHCRFSDLGMTLESSTLLFLTMSGLIQPPCSFRLCLSCLSTLLSAPVINIVHIHSWSIEALGPFFRSLVDSCVLRHCRFSDLGMTLESSTHYVATSEITGCQI
jgi:hypothetical protein